jgi:hypothetical protein
MIRPEDLECKICFNPHPLCFAVGVDTVSILTRPCGRVLLGYHFDRLVSGKFQSSPGLAAGCFYSSSTIVLVIRGFNPHPALRPGASYWHLPAIDGVPVSILTRPCGRVLLSPFLWQQIRQVAHYFSRTCHFYLSREIPLTSPSCFLRNISLLPDREPPGIFARATGSRLKQLMALRQKRSSALFQNFPCGAHAAR